MPDISMCKGNGCPIKENCYRYKAIPEQCQSFFLQPPYDHEKKECMAFWIDPPIRGTEEIDKMRKGKESV